jgi:hypothetical protein
MKAVFITPLLLLALSIPAFAQKGTIGDKPPASGTKGAPRPPNWRRHLLACSAEKRTSQNSVIAATLSQLRGPALLRGSFCILAFENAPGVETGQTVRLRNAGAVAHQPSCATSSSPPPQSAAGVKPLLFKL